MECNSKRKRDRKGKTVDTKASSKRKVVDALTTTEANDQDEKPPQQQSRKPVKISSRAAAEKLRQASQEPGCHDSNPLLVITSACSGDGNSSGLASCLRLLDSSADKNQVRVVVDHLPWDETSLAEIAAAALGFRSAEVLFKERTCDVLLITSGLRVHDFFLRPKGKLDQYADAETWLSSLQLLWDFTEHVFLAKVRSAHSKDSGFFDYEAISLFAGVARNPADMIHHSLEESPPLTEADLKWLETSEDKKSEVKKGRSERKKLLRKRMKLEWGIESLSGLYSSKCL
ncbi:MAG: hypothetical protein SGARI_006135 [Bacillariaceae sp.]